MIRTFVGAMHIALGGLVVLEGVVLMIQARANIAWEAGFYGTASGLASQILIASGLSIAIGVITLLGGVSFARGARTGQWLLFNSLVLMCLVPEFIAWLLLVGAGLVLVDQWQRALAAARRPDDSPLP